MRVWQIGALFGNGLEINFIDLIDLNLYLTYRRRGVQILDENCVDGEKAKELEIIHNVIDSTLETQDPFDILVLNEILSKKSHGTRMFCAFRIYRTNKIIVFDSSLWV